MSLSDLASLGSFVSGVAVLVTLIFLVLQMRQSNRNQRSLMQQGRSARAISTNLTVAQPDLARIFDLGIHGDEAMTATEIASYTQLAAAAFINFEDTFRQHRSGMLDDESIATDLGAIRAFAVTPGFRAVWEMHKHVYSTDFRSHMDEVIRSVKVVAPLELADLWRTKLREQAALMTSSG